MVEQQLIEKIGKLFLEILFLNMAKSNLSPTARTLRTLRQEGVICQVVERWNAFAGPHGIRIDLFNFIDVIALYPDKGIVGVQCCARSGHAAHRTKILDNEIAPEWIKAGGTIEIWSWGKQKLKRGGKAMRWVPKIETITFDGK